MTFALLLSFLLGFFTEQNPQPYQNSDSTTTTQTLDLSSSYRKIITDDTGG